MKKLPTGNCPYCDSERGINTAWGMSPQGWGNMKDDHDAGHPNYESKISGALREVKGRCNQCVLEGNFGICDRNDCCNKKQSSTLPKPLALDSQIEGDEIVAIYECRRTINAIIKYLQSKSN